LPAVIQQSRGNAQIVILTYDAAVFDDRMRSKSAVLSEDVYRQSGAIVITMPEVIL
jgi:hypothetical protein